MSDKILVANDDPAICELISSYLKNDGFDVIFARSGKQTLFFVSNKKLDLILLDFILPDIAGNQLVHQIRTLTNIPVLFFSTHNSAIDKVIGLSAGADDYIIKSVSRIELIARIKAHLRRYRQSSAVPNHAISTNIGQIKIDILQRRLWIKHKEINLTNLEFNLMKIFMQNPGQILTKDQLFQLVWGDEFFDNNTLMVAIRRLRAKIESNPTKPKLIETVWGVGYRLSCKTELLSENLV